MQRKPMRHDDARKGRKGASQLNCRVDPQAGDRAENEAKTQSTGQLAGGRVNGPQAQELRQPSGPPMTRGEGAHSQHVPPPGHEDG